MVASHMISAHDFGASDGPSESPTTAAEPGTVSKLIRSMSIVNAAADAAENTKKSIQGIPPEAVKFTPVERVPLAAAQSVDVSKVYLEAGEATTFKVGDVIQAKVKDKKFQNELFTGIVVAPLSTVFDEADADHDGKLTFEEWKDRLGHLMYDEDLRILFDACDTDKNGTLDAEEFKRGLNGKYEIKWAQVLVVPRIN